MAVFDADKFMALSGLALGQYVDAVNSSGCIGLDGEILGKLLGQVHAMDEEHASYLVLWGIKLRLSGISDFIVGFLNRDAPWHGPQYTIIQSLHGLDELTENHLDQIKPWKLATFLTATFPDVFPKEFEDLRREAKMRAK